MPGVRWLRKRLAAYRKWNRFTTSADYWESRYEKGGTSGNGSYGPLAEFKAEVINHFVQEHEITSVVEFGCGDGNQLLYAVYPRLVGLDVAREAIPMCRDKFNNDASKSFFFYDSECFVDGAGVFRADLALSLDVLYHLVEDHVFTRYMELLFQAARRFIIIYSSNHDEITSLPYERERKFTHYVPAHFPQWQLIVMFEN